MRLFSTPVRYLLAPTTRIVARLRLLMGSPLRRPKMTTRLLMVVVVVVAVGIWAVMNVPQAIELAIVYRANAEIHARSERGSQDTERESLARAKAIEAELDQWRRDTGSADQLSEHYFASRRDGEKVDARYQREMAAYHANLKDKYRWASWFPLVSVAPDPVPPPDPLSSPALEFEPGKTYQIVSKRGVSVSYSPNGTSLAVGCRDRTIRLLELPFRKELAVLRVPESVGVYWVFSPDGKAIFSAGLSPFVWRWDVVTGQTGPAFRWIDPVPGQSDSLSEASALCCSPDGGTIAVAAAGLLGKTAKVRTAVRLLDARTGELRWEYKGTATWPHSIAFSPDGAILACGNGAALLLDTRTGKLKTTLTPLMTTGIAVAFSPDGRTLAGAGSDTAGVQLGALGASGRVTLWDVPTGRVLRALQGPTERARSVVFSPDGQTVAAAGTGRAKRPSDMVSVRRVSIKASEVRLWDVATGRLIWIAEGESEAAYSLCFSPDGKSLAFCDEEYVYVLDAVTGRLKQIVMETVTTSKARDRAKAQGTTLPAGR